MVLFEGFTLPLFQHQQFQVGITSIIMVKKTHLLNLGESERVPEDENQRNECTGSIYGDDANKSQHRSSIYREGENSCLCLGKARLGDKSLNV